jgi:hypothetical protein
MDRSEDLLRVVRTIQLPSDGPGTVGSMLGAMAPRRN